MDYYCLMVCHNVHIPNTLSWSYTLNKLLKGVVESTLQQHLQQKRNERASFLTFFQYHYHLVSYIHTPKTLFLVVRPEFRGMNIFIIIISSRTLLFMCVSVRLCMWGLKYISFWCSHRCGAVHVVLLNYYNDDVMELSKLLWRSPLCCSFFLIRFFVILVSCHTVPWGNYLTKWMF